MHAMAGVADGGLCHTVSGTQWHNLWFNDTLVGETGINAALCGHYGCPVLLVTGDEAVCREAKALLGDGLTTVAVKKSFGRQSARNIPPERARKMIEEGAERALANPNAVRPFDPGKPCEVRVEFATTDGPPQYLPRAGVELLDGRTISSRAEDWLTAWRQFWG
jgi:D-amino peptidase